MRIVFINLQTNHLVLKTMSTILLKQNIPNKYYTLIKELLRRDDIQICNYITPKGTSFLPRSRNYPFAASLAQLEYKKVITYNNLDLKRITVIKKAADIKTTDIVLAFIHTFASCEDLEYIKAIKILHINQFNYTGINIENEKKWKLNGYIGEANLLCQNGLFSDYHTSFDGSFYVLPFTINDRFKNKKLFNKRINKAVATGTLATCNNKQYVEYYKTKYLHSMRVKIYESLDYLNEVIDSIISPFMEKTSVKNIKKGDNVIAMYYKVIYNALFVGKQKSYFAFNIVDKYNDYKMAVVPEEIVGVPAIGSIEAMACGTAFIGIDHPMYSDLGFIPGVNYITYDGTIEGLKNTIEYYQQNNDELERIATEGQLFVINNFNVKNVANNFIKYLKSIN